MPMDWFWQTAQPVKVGQADAEVLGPEALLLHLCGHLALHHRTEMKLLWQHDVVAVIACYTGEIDWDTVIERAQRDDLVVPLQEILRLCAREWGAPSPTEILARISALKPTVWRAPCTGTD